MDSIWQILKPWDEIELYFSMVHGKPFFCRLSVSLSKTSDNYCSNLKVFALFKINLEMCIDNRIILMNTSGHSLLQGAGFSKKMIYPKASTTSYTSPTKQSPGSPSELYLACRRGTRGAAKNREAPFSSWLCHRRTSGYLLLKIHPLGSRLPPAQSDGTRSSPSPSSSQCRFSIGVHMQQSLIWREISLHIRVYEWLI